MIGLAAYNFKNFAIWWHIFRMASHMIGPMELPTTHELVDVGLE